MTIFLSDGHDKSAGAVVPRKQANVKRKASAPAANSNMHDSAHGKARGGKDETRNTG